MRYFCLHWAVISGLTLALSGCSALRSAPPPTPRLPAHWLSAPQSTSATRDNDNFWASLGDPALPALLKQALRQNDDLKLSALRMKLAQLTASLTGLTRWPSTAVAFSAGVSRSMTEVNGVSPWMSRSAGMNVSLNYPLDIWGAELAQRDAANLDAQASESDWLSARLALCASVAIARWQLGYLNRLQANTRADLEDARNTLQLAQIRYQSGATSQGDLTFAQRSVADLRVVLSANQQRLFESRRTFSILMGDLPQTQQHELDSLQDTPLPTPAVGIPADLLARRADVHAAELRVRSSLANSDATALSFYPSLTLTAGYGTASPTLKHYLANPVGSLAATLVLPFIQFNTARITRQSAHVIYEAEAVNFRKTLMQALMETEDALSARQQLIEQGQYLRESLTLAQEAERLTRARWQHGSTDIQPWIDAQRARRQASLNLLQNVLDSKINAVQLYVAIGGQYTQRAPNKDV